MYFEGLNSSFCNFMEEKVKYNLYLSVESVLEHSLFETESTSYYYRILPLFNFDSVTSTDSEDHTENNNALILKKNTATLLSFKSDMDTMEYSEIKSETTIDGVKYTLYFTYDKFTGEPARHKMTSSGNVTDEYGYYLDSEVVS